MSSQWEKIRSKIKVVIVDDSDFTRSYIRSVLEKNNIQVAGEASNAEDAVQVIAKTRPEIALIDVVMPEKSGIELAEVISKNYKRTTVMMISSLALEQIILDSIAAGARDFIQKPFTEEALMHSLAKVCEQVEVYS